MGILFFPMVIRRLILLCFNSIYSGRDLFQLDVLSMAPIFNKKNQYISLEFISEILSSGKTNIDNSFIKFHRSKYLPATHDWHVTGVNLIASFDGSNLWSCQMAARSLSPHGVTAATNSVGIMTTLWWEAWHTAIRFVKKNHSWFKN